MLTQLIGVKDERSTQHLSTHGYTRVPTLFVALITSRKIVIVDNVNVEAEVEAEVLWIMRRCIKRRGSSSGGPRNQGWRNIHGRSSIERYRRIKSLGGKRASTVATHLIDSHSWSRKITTTTSCNEGGSRMAHLEAIQGKRTESVQLV